MAAPTRGVVFTEDGLKIAWATVREERTTPIGVPRDQT